MRLTELSLPGLTLVEPKVFRDSRGYFLQAWHSKEYRDAGFPDHFAQDNLSLSSKGTIRGLHYQKPFTQGKLVFVLMGVVWDVAVDLRVGSPTFGRWEGVTLSENGHEQLYVPPGFAHGFCVTSKEALVFYKCTDIYSPESEHGVAWDDPGLSIPWPAEEPLISEKDNTYPFLQDIPADKLFCLSEGFRR